MRAAAAVVALLLAGGAQGTLLGSNKKQLQINQKNCKTWCQRFAMKAMGPDFANIRGPTDCCKKCDAVFLQVTPLQAATQHFLNTGIPPKDLVVKQGSQPGQGPVVKR